MNPLARERRSRDTRPPPAWRGADPATAQKATWRLGDLPTWPKSTGRQVAKSKKRNPATARKATPRRAAGQGAGSERAEGIGR